MKTFRLAIATCSLSVAFAAVVAENPPSGETLTANPVYQKNCAKCHGKTAEGRHFGGPSLFLDKPASADDLRNMIANGKGRMPKYGGKLTAEEIDRLVQQIETLNKK
ncbi:MAG: cytochrome c [Terriglobales bacterium]